MRWELRREVRKKNPQIAAPPDFFLENENA
jgi:hypothetical protein